MTPTQTKFPRRSFRPARPALVTSLAGAGCAASSPGVDVDDELELRTR